MSGKVRDVIAVAVVCETMGWTWDEYWSQPAHFVEAIYSKMEVDAKKQQHANKKH